MKIKHLLTKTLLVAAGLLLGGANSVWADDTPYSINSTESAYVDATDNDSKAAVHNGASLTDLLAYNVQVRNWKVNGNSCNAKFNSSGKLTLYKFPLASLKSETGNIKSATLKITINSTGDSKDVSTLGVFGYNGSQDWTGASLTYNTLTNTGVNDIGYTVDYGGSFPILDENNHKLSGGASTVLNISCKNYLKSAMDDDRDYISFAVSNNSTRETRLNVSATLDVVYTTDAEYTVNFVDASDNIIKTEDRIGVNGASLAMEEGDDDPIYQGGKKYIYTGNDAGARTISQGAVLKISFREAATYNYTVNTSLGATLEASTGFEGDSKTVAFNKYVLVDGTLYQATAIDDSNRTFSTTFTLDADNKEVTIPYNVTEITNVSFYAEGEDIASVTKVTNGTLQTRGSGKQGAVGDNTTVTTLTPGSYKITAVFGGKKNKTFNVKVGANTVINVDASTDVLTTYASEVFNVAENTTVTFSGGTAAGTPSNSYGLDYIYVQQTAVSNTITSAGWATLYTPYALNFSGVTGLKAYTATLSGTTVTLNHVDDVPANTGVVLEGAANTYNIPIVASSSTPKGNLTGNASAETAFDAFAGNDLYMLAQAGGDVQFTKVTSGSIDAGKAFLKVAESNAPVLNVVINGETTGISEIKTMRNAENEIFFDLQGRKVAQPAKGLYIQNGRKVILK